MKRLRHIRHSATLQEAQNVNDEQQSLPIALIRFLLYWDVLGISKFDDLAYENLAVWLIQHLPKAHALNDVERLLLQYFTEQTGSDTFTVDIRFLIKFLADDVFQCWTDYLSRNNPLAFTTPNRNTHARARMLQHYLPRVNTR